MGDDDPRGLVNLDPRGMIGRIYVEYLMVLEKKIFLRFPIVSLREMMTPGASLI